MELRGIFSLYAMTFMHQCSVLFEDGSKALLKITSSDNTETATLCVTAAADDGLGANIKIGTPMFMTELRTFDNCEPELLSLPEWECLIELSKNWKLTKLG